MTITLSCRIAICQSVAEVQLTGVASLGAVSHRFNLISITIRCITVNKLIKGLYTCFICFKQTFEMGRNTS